MDKELAKLLGIRKALTGDFDLARLVEQGLPTSGLERVKGRLNLSDLELSDALSVSKKTLYRLKRETVKLELAVSDRLARVARVAVIAHAVLESAEGAEEWLRTEQVGLGGRIPLTLLKTDAGTREVERLLGRMEYGVIS